MTVQDATWLPRLAEAAERSLPTIKRLERADGDAGRTKSERLFRRLWRKAGVEFIEENGGGAGVRMKSIRKRFFWPSRRTFTLGLAADIVCLSQGIRKSLSAKALRSKSMQWRGWTLR